MPFPWQDETLVKSFPLKKKKKPKLNRTFLAYFTRITLSLGLPRWPSGKESACQCRRYRFIHALGRSIEEGNGNLLKCTCLENPKDKGAGKAIVSAIAKE